MTQASLQISAWQILRLELLSGLGSWLQIWSVSVRWCSLMYLLLPDTSGVLSFKHQFRFGEAQEWPQPPPLLNDYGLFEHCRSVWVWNFLQYSTAEICIVDPISRTAHIVHSCLTTTWEERWAPWGDASPWNIVERAVQIQMQSKQPLSDCFVSVPQPQWYQRSLYHPSLIWILGLTFIVFTICLRHAALADREAQKLIQYLYIRLLFPVHNARYWSLPLWICPMNVPP